MNIFTRMKSIKQKILIGGGIALLIVAVSLIAYAGTSAYSISLENAKNGVEKNAIEQAGLIKTKFDIPLGDSRALANAFIGVRSEKGEISRENTVNMLKTFVQKNTNYLATGTIWEPNRYTEAGDDARYAGKGGYESNGRMRAMILRDNSGTITRKMYDPTKSTEPGEYYSLTRDRMKQVVTEPVTNPAIGRTEPFISFTAPVIVNGTFMGIFINDISTATLDDIVDNIDLYNNQAVAILLSEKGQVVGVQTQYDQWLGKNWRDAGIPFIDPTKIADAEQNYHTGKITTIEERGYVRSVVPIEIGETGSTWGIVIAVPTTIIIADAIKTVLNLIIVGIIMSLVGLAILFYAARSISAPIEEVTRISEQMALGNVDLDITYTSQDEIGKLAESFRSMIGNFHGKTIAASTLSEGEMGMTIPVASEEDSLGIAMTRMQGAIVGVMTTVKDLARASEAGDMQKRGDPDMFSGEFKNIIIELNNTLDSVMTPVNEAMRLAGSYAKGDFTDRMNNDLIVKGDFIPFKEALNQIGIQGNRAVGGVKSDIEKLSSEMEGTGASAAEIAKTAGVLAESSHSVSSLAGKSGNAITQTLSAMEDLTRTVSSVAEKSDSASRMASKTVELSDSGSKLAGNAETGMEGIMHAVQETSSIMNDITGQMDEIGKIVDLISGIAEQTGLLALNAAIEAARAGDAGRGFAVVADEVKALALDSQRSAENISSIIKNLQNKSQMGSESMKNSALEVEKGNEAVRATLKVFDQIVEAVNQVHNNMAEVAAATEEQAAAVEEITASVSEVGILIQETAQEAAGSAASTQEVTSLIEQITAAIVTANMAIENIADEMGIFTTVKNEKRQETR